MTDPVDFSFTRPFYEITATQESNPPFRERGYCLLERVLQGAARQIGMDPADLRRRNLIPPERIPYRTATGTTYDSGDFPGIFEKALAAADYGGQPPPSIQADIRRGVRPEQASCRVVGPAVPSDAGGRAFRPG